MCDICLRHEALAMAIQSNQAGDTADQIVARAVAFEDYMTGADKRDAEPEKGETTEEELPPEIQDMKNMLEEIFGKGSFKVTKVELDG